MKQAKTLRWVLGSVSLLGVAMSGTSAMAQTTDNLTVQATVSGSCSVTGGTLDFGTYSGAELDGQTDIGFNCSAPSNVTIQLSGGTTDDPTARQMFNAANSQSLNYSLFQNSARTTLWGQLPNDQQTFPNVQTGTPTVFGRIPANEAALPDTYSDTVLITLTTN